MHSSLLVLVLPWAVSALTLYAHSDPNCVVRGDESPQRVSTINTGDCYPNLDAFSAFELKDISRQGGCYIDVFELHCNQRPLGSHKIFKQMRKMECGPALSNPAVKTLPTAFKLRCPR